MKEFEIKELPNELFIEGDIPKIINWYLDQKLEKEKEYNSYLRQNLYEFNENDISKEYNNWYYQFSSKIDNKILTHLKINSGFSELPLELQCDLEDIIWREKNIPTISEDYYKELKYVTKLYNEITKYE